MMTNASRRIVGLIGFAVIFSVIGMEIGKAKQTTPPPSSGNTVISGPAKIILGGTIAAALLSFLAEAGQAAEEWAVGLAIVAAASAMLVNGAPVWGALNTVLSSKPTTPISGASKPTVPA